MTSSCQILRKVDDRQRYCIAVGLGMGEVVAILMHYELASVVVDDLETLSDRLKAQQVELDNRASALAKAEATVRERERDVKKRDQRDIFERRFAKVLKSDAPTRRLHHSSGAMSLAGAGRA